MSLYRLHKVLLYSYCWQNWQSLFSGLSSLSVLTSLDVSLSLGLLTVLRKSASWCFLFIFISEVQWLMYMLRPCTVNRAELHDQHSLFAVCPKHTHTYVYCMQQTISRWRRKCEDNENQVKTNVFISLLKLTSKSDKDQKIHIL